MLEPVVANVVSKNSIEVNLLLTEELKSPVVLATEALNEAIAAFEAEVEVAKAPLTELN